MIFQESINKFIKVAFLPLVIIHIIVLEHIRFTLWPEMVVYPYLFNHGFLLYKDIINPYFPTLTIFLSIFTRFFGYQPQTFQTLTWFLIIIIDIVLYISALKITKNYFLAVLSLVFFLITSTPFGINSLWFDLIQAPFIILSVYNIFIFKEKNHAINLNASLVLALVAFFIKQQAAWLLLVYFGILITDYRKNILDLFIKIYPSIIIFIFANILLISYFIKTNSLESFFNWAVVFPFLKASNMPGYISFPTIRQLLPITIILVLLLPILFSKQKNIYIFSILLSLFVFAYPRFEYFHLIPFIAIISLFIPSSFKYIIKYSLAKKIAYLFFIILLLGNFARFIVKNNKQEIRFFEQNIQSEATFINITTKENDPIYIQNGPDQLFPLASRLPIKPWADEFPWYLETNNLQQEVIESLERANPKFIIFQPYSSGGKFDLGSYRPQKIADYLDKNYQNYFLISDSLWLKEKI